MPWLLSEVKQEIKQMISSREIITGLSLFAQGWLSVLCLWFRASLTYINNCPTKCNTKQSIYYSASSPYMFRVSTTPIIRSTQNCNYSLRYWSYFCAATSLQRGQGCQPHPSSGVHKTVITASGTGHIFAQLPPSNVAKDVNHTHHQEYTKL